jgi:Domain of unknown function (DUF222)
MLAMPELVAGLCARPPDDLDADAVRSALADVGRVQSWLEAVRVRCVRRLEALSTVSGRDVVREVAGQHRSTRREAQAAVGRANAVEMMPSFEPALADGRISASHLDVLARAVRPLDDHRRAVLAESQHELVEQAARHTPEVFGELLRHRARLLDDGVNELEAQRRATRMRIWHDAVSGMFHIRGEFDPLTGTMLRTRLDGMMRSITAAGDPDGCPANPLEKLDFVRGLALVELTRGEHRSTEPDDLVLVGARYDLSIVFDAQTLTAGIHQDTLLDTGDPDVQLPIQTVQRIACLADLTGVRLGGDGMPLQLGRTTRLASRAQRRALRAVYPTCAIPGCGVPSRYCQPHHVHWWRHGGPTDLANLLPVCSHHHHRVHEGGWTLTLQPDRGYTLRYPDGTTEHIPAPAPRPRGSHPGRLRSPPTSPITRPSADSALCMAGDRDRKCPP